jgi:hypothetical protein
VDTIANGQAAFEIKRVLCSCQQAEVLNEIANLFPLRQKDRISLIPFQNKDLASRNLGVLDLPDRNVGHREKAPRHLIPRYPANQDDAPGQVVRHYIRR